MDTYSVLESGKSLLPVVWKVLTPDTSLLVYEGVLGTLSVQGTWSLGKARLLINILELRASWLSLQPGHSDNATAVTYIKHQGGTRNPAT